MAVLPEELVNAFVKSTNDKNVKKAESFMYGIVESIDGDTVNVKLDGAATGVLTPCTTSVTVAEGDRVAIMLKNRQGLITSNVSNPTVNTDFLEAGEAVISGTIHAARYEDSTGNFTMDIGSTEGTCPALTIGGYLNGDPNNKYLRFDIFLTPGSDINPMPSMWLEGSVRDNPDDDVNEMHVNIGVTPFAAVQFNGSWIEDGQRITVSSSIPWEYHPG